MEKIASRIESSINITSSYIDKAGKQEDLKRMIQLLSKATDAKINVLICGEFKRGKSSFINAFLDEQLCPVDVDICTSVVSIIQYGEKRKVIRSYGELSDLKTEEITFEDISKYSVGDANKIDNTVVITIDIPNEELKNITLIDTPGVGGLDSRHAFLTTSFMPMANIVLFMTDVNEPMTTTELSFYKDKTKYAKQKLILLNKADLKTTEEIEQLAKDTANKVAKECNLPVEEVKVIPISAAQKLSYNKTKIDKKLKGSNFETLSLEITKLVTLYKKSILLDVKNLYVSLLDSLINPLKFQLQQIKKPDAEQIALLTKKQQKVGEELEQLKNPNSPLRVKLQNNVTLIRNEVNDYLSEQGILFTSSGLSQLIQQPEAKGTDGHLWVAKQLNLTIDSLGAEIAMKLREAFEKICSQKEIEGLLQYHTQDFYYQIEEQEVFDKDLKWTDRVRHILPGVGISGLALGIVSAASTILSGGLVLVGAAGALALGYKTYSNSANDASKAKFMNAMKTTYEPQVRIAIQKLSNYVNTQIQDFHTNLITAITQKIQNDSKDMAQLQTNIKTLNQSEQVAKKRKAEIEQTLIPLETQRQTASLLLSSPLGSKKEQVKKEIDPNETIC